MTSPEKSSRLNCVSPTDAAAVSRDARGWSVALDSAVLQSGFFHHPRGIYFNLSRECHGNLKCVKIMVWKKEKRSFQLRLFNDIYHLKSHKCRWWFQRHLARSFLEPKITNMLEVNPLLPATSIHLSLP